MKYVSKWMAVVLSAFLMLTVVGCTPSEQPDNSSNPPSGVSGGSSNGPSSGSPSGSSNDPANSQAKSVSSIEVDVKPTKSEYVVGEEFTAEGGTIIVTYTDKTTEVIPMSDPQVTITPPGLSASGTKQVKVEFGGQSCRFTVQVVGKSFVVTYNENYEGAPAATTENVNSGNKANGHTPVRDGYSFENWYVDADYTAVFDFKQPIDSNMTLYALWKQNGATYYDVTFDYDFYGAKLAKYSYPVIADGTITEPTNEPVRTGYQFNGWKTADGAAFDFSAPVTGDVTVVASWAKTVSGINEYVFEAEDTNLTGKTGPALSGDAMETGMIVQINDRNASGDRCVSYLYQYGVSLEFDFASDTDVSDATVWLSLSAEYRDFVYNPGNFGVFINGVPFNYSDVSFANVPSPDDNKVDCLDFEFYLMGGNVPIKSGENRVQVVVLNSEPMQGTTIKAAAPMVDALKISTSAVLTWDASKDLPYKNY